MRIEFEQSLLNECTKYPERYPSIENSAKENIKEFKEMIKYIRGVNIDENKKE